MKITQREARRLKKRVAELEGVLDTQRRAWATGSWPGVQLGTMESAPTWLLWLVYTASKLGHAVVVTESSGNLEFWGAHLKSPAR